MHRTVLQGTYSVRLQKMRQIVALKKNLMICLFFAVSECSNLSASVVSPILLMVASNCASRYLFSSTPKDAADRCVEEELDDLSFFRRFRMLQLVCIGCVSGSADGCMSKPPNLRS
ncbi:hypothetical protein Dsin_001065 [Dipteronia sinensis]|uniref:Uncharacterized protein n=1 Tax=Dipteronia sinensis TaxID=43782 RepID=A0AAE0B4N5_9ROSI|nr:hypothetical protein Dsin_001065 [Dipteronia sinensis]